VLILNEGAIAAQGTPEEIAVSMKGGVSWHLRLRAGNEPTAIETALASFATDNRVENRTLTIKDSGVFEVSLLARNTPVAGEAGTADEDSFAEVLFDWAVAQNYKILSMSRQRLTLEDIFVRLTRETANETADETANRTNHEEKAGGGHE
jgi:ABC-2 type transport system ATP-binding protein